MAGALPFSSYFISNGERKPLSFYPNIPTSNLSFLQHSSHLLLPTINSSPTTKTRIVSSNLKGRFEEVVQEIEEAFSADAAEISDDDDDDDEDGKESSVDLLFRFLGNLFRKVSKQAKKATRSVLPPLISPKLVSFAVDGVLLLTSLSIAKALLEVVCTLGGTVFVVILLLRVIWTTVSHFQTGSNSFNNGGTYNTTQPAA